MSTRPGGNKIESSFDTGAKCWWEKMEPHTVLAIILFCVLLAGETASLYTTNAVSKGEIIM